MDASSSDEFELDFSGSSEPELWKFRAELGHFTFRAENELDFFFDIQLFLLQFYFFTPKIRRFKKKKYNFYYILL